MTQIIQFVRQIPPASLLVRMLTGALIGLVLISSFAFSVDNPDPAWGPFWRVRPLIITPLAGAFGILSFYLKDFARPQGTVMTILVYAFSALIFLVALWMGIVLGLDGTLWN